MITRFHGILGLVLTTLVILALWSSSLVVGEPNRQISATEQQQTIDAIVQQRFQQTATAQAVFGASQTIDAAFNQALTGTAGFDATVNASFASAASATAGAPLTQTAVIDSMLRTRAAATDFAIGTQIAATAAVRATENAATFSARSTYEMATSDAHLAQIAATTILENARQLDTLKSDTVLVQSGTFEMGTTPAEVSAAVEECKSGYGSTPGHCDASMGVDAYPPHQVTVATFSIERTEVTYAQFLTFMNSLGPGSHQNGCDGYTCMPTRYESETSNVLFDGANYSVLPAINDYPVTAVTWYGAKAYCEAIGRRLPTEAEWERAARGPNDTIFPWGNTWDPTKASTRRPASGEPSLLPVNSFPEGQSAFGVLNMAGNVAEWTSDWYDPRFYGRSEATIADPTGPATGTEKVVRGGSWNDQPFFARAVQRMSRESIGCDTLDWL